MFEKGDKNVAKRLEVRAKISASRKGINNRPGYKQPEITKRKISESHKGLKHSKETKKKLSKFFTGKRTGNESPVWKGNNAKYSAIHMWVRRWKGKPTYCEKCGSKNITRYNWANIDHKYIRVLEDYISMCPSCHKIYDYKFKK